MNIYQKIFRKIISESYNNPETTQLIEALIESGILDDTLLKVFIIRRFVFNKVEMGVTKLNAMWKATEEFCCSYEYVRKCVYYYKDVEHNLL
ncbi:MAG: hypothetical protein LUF90_08020 [Rikenellaceae bacterium]|nr:hypothetical protein [Rikenellaceae bacterium]